MTAETISKQTESISFTKLVLNEYFEGKATIKNVSTTLKRNDIELRSFARGGGLIKVSVKINGKFELIKM